MFVTVDTTTRPNWDKEIVASLDFLQHSVLQVPFFLMNLMKFLSPALDDMYVGTMVWKGGLTDLLPPGSWSL